MTGQILTKYDTFVAQFLARFNKKSNDAEDPVLALFRKRAAEALKKPAPKISFDEAIEDLPIVLKYPVLPGVEFPLPFPAFKGSRYPAKVAAGKGHDNLLNQDWIEIKWFRPEEGGPPVPRAAEKARAQPEHPPMRILRSQWETLQVTGEPVEANAFGNGKDAFVMREATNKLRSLHRTVDRLVFDDHLNWYGEVWGEVLDKMPVD